MDPVHRGQAAALLLRNPVFDEAVGRVRARIQRDWEAAQTTVEREQAWFRHNALADVCRELYADEQSGEFEIRMREMAERELGLL
jgi:hypothetical protein